MANIRQRYDDTTDNIETFVSVRNLCKEFGENAEKEVTNNDNNDDDDTFMSVRERLRRFDARQDDDDDCDNENDEITYTKVMELCEDIQQKGASKSSVRNSTGRITAPGKSSSAVFGPIATSPLLTTPAPSARNHTTPRKKVGRSKSMKSILVDSSTTNVTDQQSFPPLTVSFLSETGSVSSSSLKENSSAKEVFQYGNVLLKKVEKPIEDKWRRNIGNESTEAAADTKYKGEDGSDVFVKKDEKPIEDRWNKNITNESTEAAEAAEAADTKRKGEHGSSRLSMSSIICHGRKNDETSEWSKRKSLDSYQHKINHSSLSQSSSHMRTFALTSLSPVKYNKPKSLNHRSTSLPTVTGIKQDPSPSNRDAKYQNDLAAALKKVGLPIEDRWKTMKNSDKQVSDTSKPLLSIVPGTKQNPSPSFSAAKYQNDLALKKVGLRIEDRWKNMKNFDDKFSDSSKTLLPTVAGTKQDPPPSISDEQYQNDIASALKKVGLPIEDRWKAMKYSNEGVSDTSKPLFAKMKLRSVGTPINTTPIAAAASQFIEKPKYFDDQTTPKSLKQKYDFDDDDEKSTLAKRRRMPSTIDIAQTSAICYGDPDRTNSNSMPHKRPTEGISVSDLAKTFSAQIKLASKGEHTEEKKVIGKAPSEHNEITQIRNSLKSTAMELENLRKSLNSSTPVSRLIAERNKAAQANRSENKIRKKMGSPEEFSARNKYRRRTKSMSSSHTENSTMDGPSMRMPPSENTLACDSAGDLSNSLARSQCWEDFKASNFVENGDIWNMMDVDDSLFFDERGNSASCPTLEYCDDEISGSNDDELLPSNSTLSEDTTDTEGDYYYDKYEPSRFIQITLSSGGITEKFVPNIVMSPTEGSSESDEISMAYPNEMSPHSRFDSRRDRRKTRKKFFFGKNKRKSTPIEI